MLRARVSAWRRHRAYPNLSPNGVVRDARGARRAECFLPAMSTRARDPFGATLQLTPRQGQRPRRDLCFPRSLDPNVEDRSVFRNSRRETERGPDVPREQESVRRGMRLLHFQPHEVAPGTVPVAMAFAVRVCETEHIANFSEQSRSYFFHVFSTDLWRFESACAAARALPSRRFS